jgi:hypothetical protein
MMRFIDLTMSSWLGRIALLGGLASITIRTSAAVAPLRGREHRVEIELADLGEIADELRHALDHRRERIAIDAVAPRNASEHLSRGNAVEHRQRVFLRRRREPERRVLQYFDENAAQTERDQLAERLDR